MTASANSIGSSRCKRRRVARAVIAVSLAAFLLLLWRRDGDDGVAGPGCLECLADSIGPRSLMTILSKGGSEQRLYLDPASGVAGRYDDRAECTRIAVNNGTREIEISPLSLHEFYDPNSGCEHGFRGSVAFFHVGKAGGGTVGYELRRNRIGIAVSHPAPRPSHVARLRSGSLSTLIVNVRDPVDRFVSAFVWQLGWLCGPGSGEREWCTPERIEEEEGEFLMLRDKYRGDPNALAEALCEDSPGGQEAAEDYARIGHSRTLSAWLDFLVDPSTRGGDVGLRSLIALPLGKRGKDYGTRAYDERIRKLSLHLLESRYGQAMAEEMMSLGGKAPESLEAQHRARHSSFGRAEGRLSALGQCCLARHLSVDYRLIRTMLGDYAYHARRAAEPLDGAHPTVQEACSWGDEAQTRLCRVDLRSILLRRARYLDASLGTCSRVVAGDVQN